MSKCNSAVRSQSAKPKVGYDAKKELEKCLKRCNSSGSKKRGSVNQIYFSSIKKQSIKPKVMTLKEYEYYKNQAFGKTKEQLEVELEKAEKEKEVLVEESMKRKEKIRAIDIKKSKQKDKLHSEIEAETAKRTSYLLERAENLQLEQEEEIQRCNKIILETKCRIIRDAQIEEKKLIESELATEEKRLNNMMENERRWQIVEEEKKEQEKITRQQYFIQTLKNQIAENEEQRFLEFERRQEESRVINLDNIAWQQNEITKMQEKQSENARIQKQLAEVNAQLKHFKEMEKEENKIIDMRIREFQRLKDEREAKIAEEKRKLQLKKEHEKKRLAEQAVHTKQFQEQIEEINASRIQEEVEREWRRREKEEALKRLKKKENLTLAREEQIRNKRLLQAIEIERDKREYKRVLEEQKAALIREQQQLEKRHRQAEKHKTEILKQVNEKERERIESRKQLFEEGIAIQAKAEMRKKKLNDAINRKCREMKEANVPEMYIDEVRRMIENV